MSSACGDTLASRCYGNQDYTLEKHVYALYNEEDSDIVMPVLEFLRGKSLTVYDPVVDGPPSESLLQIWLNRGIYNCKKTVVFLTKQFLSSGECDFQANNSVLRYAMTKGINKHRVIVVMLQSCKRPKILRQFNCVYAWKYRQSPHEQHLRILSAITGPRTRYWRRNVQWTTGIQERHNHGENRKSTRTGTSRKVSGKKTRLPNILWNINKLKSVLDNSVITCANEDCFYRCKGPDWLHFHQHLKECPRLKVQCHLCGNHVLKRNLQRHVNDRCPHKHVKCPNKLCTSLFSYKEIEAHKRSCPFKEITCPHAKRGCKKQLLTKEKEEHVKVCDFAEIKCIGCKSVYYKRDIYSHKCSKASPMHFRHGDQKLSCDTRALETFTCNSPGCEFKGSHQWIEAHNRDCEYKPVTCPDCGKRMAHKLLGWHRKECDKILVCHTCKMNVPSSSKLLHDRYMCTGSNMTSLCGSCLKPHNQHKGPCIYAPNENLQDVPPVSLDPDRTYKKSLASGEHSSEMPTTKPITIHVSQNSDANTRTMAGLREETRSGPDSANVSRFEYRQHSYSYSNCSKSRRKFQLICNMVDIYGNTLAQAETFERRGFCQQSEFYT